jgi:hypothetical protein
VIELIAMVPSMSTPSLPKYGVPSEARLVRANVPVAESPWLSAREKSSVGEPEVVMVLGSPLYENGDLESLGMLKVKV